ncbi:MAG: Tfp pilus assembly protein FimT/FimU [bacterium]
MRKENKETKRGFTLVEVLIAISIIAVILISILSFRIYYNNYLQSLIIKNNLKAAIAKAYYNSIFKGEEFPSNPPSINNHLRDIKGKDSFSFNLDKMKITYSTLKFQRIRYNEDYEAIITTQNCNVLYKYKNKEINFDMDLPFVCYRKIPHIPRDPREPGYGTDPNNPQDPIGNNLEFIFAAKSF